MSADAAARVTARAGVVTVVALTTLAQIGTVMGIAVFPVIAPKLAAEMGVEPSLIGYQMSLVYGVAALSSPFLTWMVTRYGACRAMQAGLLFSVFALTLAMMKGVAALAAASILLGAAMSVMTPAGAHILFRFSPPQRRNLVLAVTLLVQEAGYGLVAAGVLLSVAQGAGVTGRIAWGWIADHFRNCLTLLITMSAVMVVCCGAMALLTPAWPPVLIALLFLVFGASAIGWNGLFLAEVARLSPVGKVSVATSGAMVWNFAGILIGPALFALIYRFNGSYTQTFGLLTLFAVAGFAFLLLTAASARRPAVH